MRATRCAPHWSANSRRAAAFNRRSRPVGAGIVATASDPRAAELGAILREIRERVRSRYPEGPAPGLEIPLPDLMPILYARDAAEAKVAAIGSVNPRPGG